MVTIEELQKLVRDLLNRQIQSEENLRALHDQNQVLSQTNIPALVEASQQAAGRSRILVDARRLGRTTSLPGIEANRLSWSRKFENFVSAAHRGAGIALDWAMGQHTRFTSVDIDGAFGAEADLNDQICGICANQSEVCTLVQLTIGESFDRAMNTTRGSGLEAYRRLARRYAPSTRRAQRPALESSQSHHPIGSCRTWPFGTSVGALGGASSTPREVPGCRRPEARGGRGQHTWHWKNSPPFELERHLQLKSGRLSRYANAREEGMLHLGTHLGSIFKDASMYLPVARAQASRRQRESKASGQRRSRASVADGGAHKRPRGVVPQLWQAGPPQRRMSVPKEGKDGTSSTQHSQQKSGKGKSKNKSKGGGKPANSMEKTNAAELEQGGACPMLRTSDTADSCGSERVIRP